MAFSTAQRKPPGVWVPHHYGEERSCKGFNKSYDRRAVFGGICGRSSGVERNLAKVEVVSSNLIARSSFIKGLAVNSVNPLILSPLNDG